VNLRCRLTLEPKNRGRQDPAARLEPSFGTSHLSIVTQERATTRLTSKEISLTHRRNFLRHAGAAGAGLATAAAVSVAGPAVAQAPAGLPEIKWRMSSSFPKSLDTLFGAAELISRTVAAATGGKFQIQVFAAGEIVPAFGVVDAVQNGTIQCAQTAPYYFFGKDPTFAFACAVPFGMNARQQNAWMYHGGGLALMRDFLAAYNIINFPCGNTGAQMGGFFRKEIKGVADLQGVKMRIAGFAGAVMAKLGVVPQQIPAGDLYPALEKGTIDAAEWVGPYDDEKLGLGKVAKYYYYPGFWEGGPELDLFVNTKEWAALPKEYQVVLEAACAQANVDMLAKYDNANPAALRRLIASGVLLRPFPQDMMQAAWKAANEIYVETAAANPRFAKVYEAWKTYRDEQILWFRVCEQNFDNFMARTGQPAAKK
jgi:TRAP-type mannitol/chloroaromatic compound transport system substrate-binding protein